jgi:hypothetical protein
VRLINTEIAGEPLALEGTISESEVTAGVAPVPDGEIYVTAENLGNANINGAKVPVKIKDVLPTGLKAVGIAATKAGARRGEHQHLRSAAVLA